MKAYSPSEVAEILKIKQPTLRKYSIMLEERGYNISRNSQNHRFYQDKDIITLRRVITGSKSGVTLEEAINNVINLQRDNTYTNDINNGVIANGNDTQSNNTDITELKEMVHKQNELIGNLIKRLDQQQEYIDKKMNERDQALMQTLNQSIETQKQIATAQENKTIWQKLFKKQ